MITIYLREHGTHNAGFGFDFEANLNDYTSSKQLTEDLFEYTRKQLEDENINAEKIGCEYLEEWLITDYEFEDGFSTTIGEYDSLDRLIALNTTLNDLSMLERKVLTSMLSNGYDFEEAAEKISNNEVVMYDGSLSDWCYDMVEEGLFGDIHEFIRGLINYDDMAFALSCNDNYIDEDDISYYVG